MAGAYVGKVIGDVQFDHPTRGIIVLKCWLLRESAYNTRILKVGLSRGRDHEMVVKNNQILARHQHVARGSKAVPDGKTYPRIGTFSGERVYVCGRGRNNTRICPIEGADRHSYLVDSEYVTDIVTQIESGGDVTANLTSGSLC